MKSPHPLQMFFEGGPEPGGKISRTVFITFPSPNNDLPIREIEIFDPQAHSFRYSKTAAVENPADQCERSGEMRKQQFCLLRGKNYRRSTPLRSTAHPCMVSRINAKYLSVENQKRVESLILCTRSHSVTRSQIGQKISKLRRCEFFRRRLRRKLCKPLQPFEIALLGSISVMLYPKAIPHRLNRLLPILKRLRLRPKNPLKPLNSKIMSTIPTQCLLSLPDLPIFKTTARSQFLDMGQIFQRCPLPHFSFRAAIDKKPYPTLPKRERIIRPPRHPRHCETNSSGVYF